jgi:hypothetical protein
MMERRHHTRLVICYQVNFSGLRGFGEGLVVSLAVRGCCMRTIVSVPLRTYLQLPLKLDHTDTPIVIDLAAVRWTDKHDYGIEFLTVRAD